MHYHQQHKQEQKSAMQDVPPDTMIIVAWQSDNHLPLRREMILFIINLLQQQKPNASPEALSMLPALSKKLELSLYRKAGSLEEYSNQSTVLDRIQQLATELKQLFATNNNNNNHKRNNKSKSASPVMPIQQSKQMQNFKKPAQSDFPRNPLQRI